jgi:hypothetical protein
MGMAVGTVNIMALPAPGDGAARAAQAMVSTAAQARTRVAMDLVVMVAIVGSTLKMAACMYGVRVVCYCGGQGVPLYCTNAQHYAC